MGGGYWSFEVIPELVESGKLDEEHLDTAVARVLRAKFAMGLFEEPFTGVGDDEIFDYLNTDEHKALARQLDGESIVLLENHENTLPLKKDASVAVIGPMAHGLVNVSPSSWGALVTLMPAFANMNVVRRLRDAHLYDPRCHTPGWN